MADFICPTHLRGRSSGRRARAYRQRGLTWYERGQPARAQRALVQAVELAPANPGHQLALAILLLERGKTAWALYHLTEFLALVGPARHPGPLWTLLRPYLHAAP